MMITIKLRENELISDDNTEIGRVYREGNKKIYMSGKYNISINIRIFGNIEVFVNNEKVGEIGNNEIIIGTDKYKFSRPAVIAFVRGYSNEVLLFHENVNVAKVKRGDNELELLVESGEYLLPSLVLLLYLSPYLTPYVLPRPTLRGQRVRVVQILLIFAILIIIFFSPILQLYTLPLLFVLFIIYFLVLTNKIPRKRKEK
ncbi:MAG: hypothetical protein QXV69_07680 [Sulfolobaceae archaeon]